MQVPDPSPFPRCLADTSCMVEAVEQPSNIENSQQQFESFKY